MRKAIVVLAVVALLIVAVAAPAFADAKCTGPLSDRASSCFNAGPASDEVGFHGPG